MTADKFNATQGTASQDPPIELTRRPRTEALHRMRDIIMATMSDCADAVSQQQRDQGIVSVQYYRGKMDGFASYLSLLEVLGPQIEQEAFEQGYQLGCETPRKGVDR